MANSVNTPAGPGWKVTGQQERTIIGANAQPQNVVTVTFTLDNGTIGSVDIPAAGYSVDAVRAAIATKAQLLHDVNQLTG